MPIMSKVAVLDEINGKFTIEEQSVPEPKDDEFVVRTEFTGVCGTDVHMYYGHLDTAKYPLLMGHEIAGIIEKVGKNVTEDSLGQSVKIGDRVVVVPGVSCGDCYYCKILKTPSRCSNRKAYGFAPNTEENKLTGGFSQYVHIKYPQTSFLKTDLDPRVASLTEPLSICVHGFHRMGGVRLGSTVLVQGTGAIGLGAIAFAKRSGAGKVIAVGGPKKRLEIAKKLGAEVVIDIEDIRDPKERIRLVKEETKGGRGVDVAIECTGFPASIPEGIECLRDSAHYLELGHFTDNGSVDINPHYHIMRKNVSIHGIWASEVGYMDMTLSILERMELPYDELVSHILPLNRLEDSILGMGERGYRLEGSDDQIIKAIINPWL